MALPAFVGKYYRTLSYDEFIDGVLGRSAGRIVISGYSYQTFTFTIQPSKLTTIGYFYDEQ